MDDKLYQLIFQVDKALSVSVRVFRNKLTRSKKLRVLPTRIFVITNLTQFHLISTVACKRFVKTMSGCQNVKVPDGKGADTSIEVLESEEIKLLGSLPKTLTTSDLDSTGKFDKALQVKEQENFSEFVASGNVDSESSNRSSKLVVNSLECEKFKTVGTQSIGSSEDCIHVFKYTWSEGEEDVDEEECLEAGLQVLYLLPINGARGELVGCVILCKCKKYSYIYFC